MRFRSLRLVLVALIPLALVAAACSDDSESSDTTEAPDTTAAPETTEAPATADQTIVDIAASDPQFSTLVAALQAAGLDETLSGEGPYTVFAPTDDAFAALPAGTVDSLLADPEGALTDVLTLHVIDGEVLSDAAIGLAGQCATTLGGDVSVELDGDNLVVGGATVTTADIQASNGVIHVIDGVITTADCAG